MQDFSVEEVFQMFGEGLIFEGRNNILLLRKALKFGIIFKIYESKLLKIWKLSRKF